METVGCLRELMNLVESLWVVYRASEEFCQKYSRRVKKVKEKICNVPPGYLLAAFHGLPDNHPLDDESAKMANDLKIWAAENWKFPK